MWLEGDPGILLSAHLFPLLPGHEVSSCALPHHRSKAKGHQPCVLAWGLVTGVFPVSIVKLGTRALDLEA